MKQQVNLYLPEFRVQKDPVTPLLMGQILGGIVITMIVMAAFDFFTRWQLSNELSELSQVLAVETQKTNQLDSQLAQRTRSEDLANRLASAEATLASSRQIAEFLSETKLGNVRGFSEQFKDLSRASIAGLSITEFEFVDGGIGTRIAGKVANSALVPLYVNNIKQGKSPLRSARFSPRISREGDRGQFYSFELSNKNE